MKTVHSALIGKVSREATLRFDHILNHNARCVLVPDSNVTSDADPGLDVNIPEKAENPVVAHDFSQNSLVPTRTP